MTEMNLKTLIKATKNEIKLKTLIEMKTKTLKAV